MVWLLDRRQKNVPLQKRGFNIFVNHASSR
jgi:hypothetical protein